MFEDEAFISSVENIHPWWDCTRITEEIRFLCFPVRTNVL